jgi:DNA-binding response OmpR family regulator
MGMMLSNKQFPAVVHSRKKLSSGAINDVDASEQFCRASVASFSAQERHFGMSTSTHTNWVKYVKPVEGVTKFRVLLAGKEQHERQCMCNALLQNLNFPVEYIEACCGDAALRIGSRESINLIIFSSDIADMDGLEFLGRLNKQCGQLKIPVIEILSSEAARKGVQVMRMGAHDYLLKDFDGHHFELLPILVSRIYLEQQEISALRQKASIHRTIADSISAVTYQLSLQGGTHDIHISRQISELGLSADKWGNDAELHHQLCHDADRPIVKAALEHSYKTGEIFQCEYRIKTAMGVLRWFHDKAKVIMDKYGRPAFLQGVMTDISGMKSMESELRHYREMLDKMVKDRTEFLDRRLAILETCNSTLCENYHKMHLMYLDLWHKAQAGEGGICGSGDISLVA